MKDNMIIVTNEKINQLLEEEERCKRGLLDLVNYAEEHDELLYTHWFDRRTKQHYLVRCERTVHVGFNDTPIDKVEEIRRIVEKEGACHASWGVTGRTMHSILASQLAQMLPEYDFAIDGYECRITKRN